MKNKKQLIAEIQDFADNAPVLVAIGRQKYAIDKILTSSDGIHLISSAKIGRTSKYRSEQEKVDFNNAKRKKENQDLTDEQILEKLRNQKQK